MLQARGKDGTVLALSAPIYVSVDGQRFWKPSVMPGIVARMKAPMQELLETGPRETNACTQGWYTQEKVLEYWKEQKAALKQRIDQASALYDDLLRRAAAN